MGGEPQLHRVDAVCFGDIFAADVFACDEEHDELCVGDYSQRCSLGYVRSDPLFRPDGPTDAIFLSPKDVVLRRVSGCIITKHETTDAELSLVAAVDITMGLMHMSRKKSRLRPEGSDEKDTVDSKDKGKTA